jgi:transposase
MTHFLQHARSMLTNAPELDAIRKALKTLHTHIHRILQRWTSTYSNARMEGLNSLFQAARARARGYRNTQTFSTMIYLIAAPIRFIFNST